MDEKRYAILIANSQFPEEPKFSPLRCPEKDADELAKVLRSEQSNFTDVTVLKNEPYYKILKTISRTFRTGGKDDLYLIYYSGHGKLDLKGSLYLATFDTTIDDLLVTAIEATKILDIPREHFKKKTVLILDCCYSGAIERRFKNDSTGMLEVTFKSDQDEIEKINDKLKKVNQSTGTYVLTASTSHQQAVEKEGDELSLFTKHIIEGIRSSDASEDGEITMSSLYEYVRRKVSEEGYQEPMKFETAVNGAELILASADVSKFSTQKLTTRGRELIFVRYAQDIPRDIKSEALNIFDLDRDHFSGEQKKKFTLIQNLIQNPKTVDAFVKDWENLKIQQEQIVAYCTEAEAALKEEKWAQAAEKLNTVLKMDPDHKQALNDLKIAQQQLKLAELYEKGRGFYQSGDFDKAIPYFEQIYTFFPDYKDVDTLLRKAQSDKTSNDRQAREVSEHEELEKQRKKAEAAAAQTYAQGIGFFKKSDWREALRKFNEMIDWETEFPGLRYFIDDSNIFLRAETALSSQALQKLQDARTELKKVNEVNASIAQMYLLKIEAVIKKNSREKDKKAVEIKVEAGDAHLAVEQERPVHTLISPAGHSDGSGTAAEKEADELYYLAKTAIGKQHFQDAIQSLQKALILKPAHPELLEELEKAEKQQKWATLYAAAKDRINAKDWRGALENLYGIHYEEEYYKDVSDLIQLAEAEAEGKEQDQQPLVTMLMVFFGLLALIIGVSVLYTLLYSSGENSDSGKLSPVSYGSKSTPTPTPAPTPRVLTKAEINQLVGATIRDINAAIQKGDFTEFYKRCSADNKEGSAAMLKSKFRKYLSGAAKQRVADNAALIANQDPVYSIEPIIGTFDNGLRTEGKYVKAGVEFEFKYSWDRDSGSWRLNSLINITI
jgi:tetratricopeptide (TPR) repeat protein